MATAQKLKVLEEQYWNKREAEGTWKRKKTFGDKSDTIDSNAEPYGSTAGGVTSPKNETGARSSGSKYQSKKGDSKSSGILKKSGTAGEDFKPMFDYRNLKKSKAAGGGGETLKEVEEEPDDLQDSAPAATRKDNRSRSLKKRKSLSPVAPVDPR